MPLNIKELSIESPDFKAGEFLNDRHAQGSGNVVPRLIIRGTPAEAVELAVVCHDPDAPLPHGFTHWTLYGIPASTTDLTQTPDASFRAGPNGVGSPGYIGPQPPADHGIHHYYFWVYALDTHVDGTPSYGEFLRIYGENIVEQNRIVGLYQQTSR